MKYSTSQLADHFGVSRTTIINWTDEFQEFLSTSSRPTEGLKRNYTSDDLRVFKLVKSMLDSRMLYDEIYASLKNTDFSMAEVDALANLETPSDSNALALLQSKHAELMLVTAERDRYKAGQQKAELRAEILEDMMAERQQRIDELNRQIGELNNELRRASGDNSITTSDMK